MNFKLKQLECFKDYLSKSLQRNDYYLNASNKQVFSEALDASNQFKQVSSEVTTT